MARVEWTRQSGDDVETVVGMLLCSRYPNAVRVRPSQGDGGIDIFVPGPAGFGVERAVFQVKRYNSNLVAKQKRKIKDSFNTVVETSEREGWRITEWHLVMPLDLTTQNLGWLDAIVSEHDFPSETHGLLYCDTLAADYPKIVDYYLRDGKDRLQAELNNLTKILDRRDDRTADEPLTPRAALPDIVSIYKALNACDPFYRYAYSVSDQPPSETPGPGEDDGLVAVCAMEHESVWISVKIYALSRASLEERPIEMQFNLQVPASDKALREHVQKFFDYGSPLRMPEGTVSGFLDLPAGLGGELTGASLHVLSAVDQVDNDETELIIAMLAPDSDTVIAETVIRRTEFSSGIVGGFRSLWSDCAKLFTLEMLTKEHQCAMNLKVDYQLEGRRPAEIVDSLRFLAAMQAPNRIGLAVTHGPREFTVASEPPTRSAEDAQRWAAIAGALASIQERVAILLRMPKQMTGDQAADIMEAAQILQGEALSGPLTGEFTVHHSAGEGLHPQLDREFEKVYEFAAIKAIKITLGTDVIPVGKQALFVLGQYTDIGDDHSRIKPVSDGVNIRYDGTAEVGRVVARHFHGTIVDTSTNESHG